MSSANVVRSWALSPYPHPALRVIHFAPLSPEPAGGAVAKTRGGENGDGAPSVAAHQRTAMEYVVSAAYAQFGLAKSAMASLALLARLPELHNGNGEEDAASPRCTVTSYAACVAPRCACASFHDSCGCGDSMPITGDARCSRRRPNGAGGAGGEAAEPSAVIRCSSIAMRV